MNFSFYNNEMDLRVALKEDVNCELLDFVNNIINCGVKESELGICVMAFLNKEIDWENISEEGFNFLEKGYVKFDFSKNSNKFGDDKTGKNLLLESKMFIVNLMCDAYNDTKNKTINYHEDIFTEMYYNWFNKNTDYGAEKELKEIGILKNKINKFDDYSGTNEIYYEVDLEKLFIVFDEINFLDELDTKR